MRKASRRAVLLSLCVIGAGGCTLGEATPPDAGTSLYTNPPKTTSFEGVVWDPEAFFVSTQLCGGACQPLLTEDNPAFKVNEVQGASVAVYDPATQAAVASAQGESAPDGEFALSGAPSQATPYFYQTSGGAYAAFEAPPDQSPPPQPPPASYLPVVDVHPVYTADSAQCSVQDIATLGDNGILQAVARYLTANGAATDVSDFTQTSKYKGVVVVWNYEADMSLLMRQPASNTRTDSTLGTPYYLNWAPPGMGPPFQADRGFFVDDSMPGSALGLTVILVPANAASSTVTLTTMDPSTDAQTGHPWTSPPLTFDLPPGQIALDMQPITPDGRVPYPDGPPPDWLCFPPDIR